jgi:hypothetical protein
VTAYHRVHGEVKIIENRPTGRAFTDEKDGDVGFFLVHKGS